MENTPDKPWIARGEQVLIFAVVLAALGLGIVHVIHLAGGTELSPSTSQRPDDAYKVDVNTADWTTLALVRRIGPRRAKAIVNYRVQNGGFRSLDDLRRIKGIGEKTLAKIRPFLTVGRPTAPAADAASPEPLTLKHAKTNRAPGKSRGP